MSNNQRRILMQKKIFTLIITILSGLVVILSCSTLGIKNKKGTFTKNTKEAVSGGNMETCEHNVMVRLKTIVNNYYPKWKKNNHARGVTAWFARKDLECARFRMYYNKGFKCGGRICDKACQANPKFKDLEETFLEAEKLVKEIELQKGVNFLAVKNNQTAIIFKDLKTGKELSSSESNKR